MGNLVCGSAGINFFAGMLHDAQGRLSRITQKRAKLAIQMARSGDSTNSAAEAADKALEQKQKTLEAFIAMVQQMQKAHEELFKSCVQDFAPKLSAQA